MADIILSPNAVPVYSFLSLIQAEKPFPPASQPKKILDCGAGGSLPPLALFAEYGFDAWGIDCSEGQLEMARQFCRQEGIELHLQNGDMRQIPFGDETFDYVYEHYSMCHLSKVDTARAIREMYRVLKPGGTCFLGFISTDCWPKSLFGEERDPGEFFGEEGGVENVLHSLWSDEEADKVIASWQVLRKEKQVKYLNEIAENTSLEEWLGFHDETTKGYSREAWQEQYSKRGAWFLYAHLYYILIKPS
jgi:ubiquinone/menaquinone biosynthesis C-methylase UbiE